VIGTRDEHVPDIRFPRLYLHLFATAACVLPVASYVLATFGWRPADIGVATAAVGIAGTVATPAWGWLDDRTNWAPRAALLATGVAAVAAALTLGRAPHAATWVALALFGVAEGPLDALLTTRVLASGLHGSRLGRVRSFGSLGWVVGLGLAATTLSLWPDHAEWVWVVAALTALTAPRFWGDRMIRPPADPAPARGGRLPLGPVLRVLVVTFPTSMAMSALVQFTAGWAHQDLSAGPFLALAPIALSAALELPVFPWVDRLVRTRSPLVAAVLAGPFLAVATALMALFPSSGTMLAVQPLIAVSFSLWFVGQSRMLALAVPADRQASAQTLGAALSGGVGGLLAGVVGGHLADSVGYRGLFTSLAVLTLVGTLVGLAAAVRARKGRRDRPAPPVQDPADVGGSPGHSATG
jgi:MFS transporter, PPP family, 3-phenylpropionic acid transporter